MVLSARSDFSEPALSEGKFENDPEQEAFTGRLLLPRSPHREHGAAGSLCRGSACPEPLLSDTLLKTPVSSLSQPVTVLFHTGRTPSVFEKTHEVAGCAEQACCMEVNEF